jgi:hypothetical protein
MPDVLLHQLDQECGEGIVLARGYLEPALALLPEVDRRIVAFVESDEGEVGWSAYEARADLARTVGARRRG